MANVVFAIGISVVAVITIHVYRWFDIVECNQVDRVEHYRYLVTAGIAGACSFLLVLSRFNYSIVASILLVLSSIATLVSDVLFDDRIYSTFNSSNTALTTSKASQTLFNVQVFLCTVAMCSLMQTQAPMILTTGKSYLKPQNNVDFYHLEPTNRHPLESTKHGPAARNLYDT